MGKELDGYKVVRKSRVNKEICWSTLIDAATKYKILEWIKREIGNGPFAIFTDLNEARKFARIWSHLGVEIYRCKYIESKHKFGYWVGDDFRRALHFDGRDFADAVLLTSVVYAYQNK